MSLQVFAWLGFGVAVAWIYSIANEIVNVLQVRYMYNWIAIHIYKIYHIKYSFTFILCIVYMFILHLFFIPFVVFRYLE